MMWFLSAMLGDRSRSHLAAVFEAASVGVVVTDPTQRDNPVVYANAHFSKITGFRTEELVGRNLRLLQGPGTDAQAKDALRQAIEERRSVSTELVNYRKDGGPFWMKVEINPVFDPHGRLTNFVGITSDVTETRHSAATLQDQDERLRGLLDAVPLLVADAEGRISEANRHAERIFGTADLAGRDLAYFFDAKELVEKALTDEAVHQLEAKLRDGSWILVSAVRMLMAGKEAVLLVAVDIGPMKQKEEALARAKEEADRAVRAKSRFFAAASHDLRQPMQALALFTTALESQCETPLARTILQSIKISLSNMEEMFEALLDMSRLDAGVLRGAPEEFMVNDVLERLEAEFAPQAKRKGLGFRLVASSASVRTDPALLGRIMRNFLSNALRYTQSGKILLGCKLRGRNLLIIVGDTGAGIPDDQRLAIFEEFYQTGDPGEGKGGLGLGLAIVQRLSRLLGHRLELRSLVGRGSIFGVEVPLAHAIACEAKIQADEEPGDLAGATILVVDDDISIREGLRLLLGEWGCRVVAATNRTQAMQAVADGLAPHIILADFRLDDGHLGVALIEELQKVLGRPVPAFLFTGDTAINEDGTSGAKILRKPLNPMKLRAALAEALGR